MSCDASEWSQALDGEGGGGAGEIVLLFIPMRWPVVVRGSVALQPWPMPRGEAVERTSGPSGELS